MDTECLQIIKNVVLPMINYDKQISDLFEKDSRKFRH